MQFLNLLVAFLLPFLTVMGTTLTATTVSTQTISVLRVVATATQYNTTSSYVASTGFFKPTATGLYTSLGSAATSTAAMSPIESVKPAATTAANAAPQVGGAQVGAAAVVMMMVAAML